MTTVVGSVLLLTEDSATSAHETIKSVVRKMLLLVDPGIQTHRIRFEPPDPAITLVHGSLWKSKAARDYRARQDLLLYVATKLLEGPTSFVMFHVDGDKTWANRGDSENVDKFDKEFALDVLRMVEHRRQFQTSTGTQGVALTGSRLFRITPHWCIEAWLYQNTDVAARTCAENAHCRGRHVELVRGWAKDRGLLDEVEHPERALCFGSSANLGLAGAGFPASEINEAGKSFAESVTSLRGCQELRAMLAATCAG